MVAWPWNCGTQGNRGWLCPINSALLISNSQLICSHFVESAAGSLGSMGFVSFLDFIYKYVLHWLYPRPQCISFCLLQPLEVHVVERPKVTTLSYNHNAEEACWQLTLFLGRVRCCFGTSELEPATRLWRTHHGNFLRVHSTERLLGSHLRHFVLFLTCEPFSLFTSADCFLCIFSLVNCPENI